MSTPPWMEVPPNDPWSSKEAGKHDFEAVSRHAIAEAGLICPVCGTQVCERGDFSLVKRSRLGEVVRCNGQRQLQDDVVPCGKYLVASPDTEHGDHLKYDAVPVEARLETFFYFVRVSEQKAVEEKYGDDMKALPFGEIAADASKAKLIVNNTSPRLAFAEGEFWDTESGSVAQILRVQRGQDPFFDGWGWVELRGEPGIEWHVDPFGSIRFDMRDPTVTRKDRLTVKSIPV